MINNWGACFDATKIYKSIMSHSKDSKSIPKGRQSQSVYQSSDVDADLPVPTQSVIAGSELVGEIATLSLQPCEACQRTEGATCKNANWFCRECEDLLCDECQLFHKKFKTTANHKVVSLYVSCGLCSKKNISSTGVCYCHECEDFLCSECRSWHQQFKAMESHTIVKSQDKIRGKSKPTVKLLVQSPTYTKTTKGNVGSKLEPKKVQATNRKAVHASSFNVQSADDENVPKITGSAFLSDSSLLLVDNINKNLKHFDINFKLIQTKKFDYSPYRVTVNADDTVVMTAGYSKIVKLSVSNKIEVVNITEVDFACYAVDFISNEMLAVVGKNPAMFCVYTIDGTEVSRTTTDKTGANLFIIPGYVTVDRERQRAYVSDYCNNTVTALDLRRNNDVLFRYTTSNFYSADIAVTDGYINVCNCASPGSVHQISEEGVYNKLLLSEEQCMKWPITISFTHSGDRFIVGGGSMYSKDAGKTVHVYDLK